MKKNSNIILCGFMGSGKSSVGWMVSRELGLSFIDTDRIIGERCGKSISEIFREEGEAFFRAREGEIVKEILTLSGVVVATGGGMIVQPENYRRLSKMGLMILLKASPDTIYARVGWLEQHPLLASGNARGRIEAILAKRNHVYEQIEHQVNTDGLGILEVSKRVIQIFKGRQ